MKLFKKIGLLLLGGMVFFYVSYSLTKGTYSDNELFVNSGFDDEVFYNCVIDSYNNENSPSVSYDTGLSDEQLATIKSVTCQNKGITSVTGIEKLVSLTKLDLNGNNITSIDLTNNVDLEYLDLSFNNLSSLNLDNNVGLTELYIAYNKIESIDLSRLTNLLRVNLLFNKYSDATVENEGILEYIAIDGDRVDDFNFHLFTNLKEIGVYEYYDVAVKGGSLAVSKLGNYVTGNVTYSDYSVYSSFNNLTDAYKYTSEVITGNVGETKQFSLVAGYAELDVDKIVSINSNFTGSDYSGTVAYGVYYNLNFTSIFDGDYVVDEELKYIKYIPSNLSVSEFLSKINLTDTDINSSVYVTEDLDKARSNNEIVSSGDVLVLYENGDVKDKYFISVLGDPSADGLCDQVDLIQMRKHIAQWTNPNTNVLFEKKGIYYYSLDMDKSGTVDQIDLIQMRKRIAGVE